MKDFSGTGVALVTPFDAEGNVDYQALSQLLNHTAKGGVDYWVVQGTTGESVTLTEGEKKQVLDFVKQHNTKNLPIVLGVGGNNTRVVLEQLAGIDFEGIDAILSVSPCYNKPTQEGIYQHYKAIADASPVPVILYNVPGRTASKIHVKTTLRLAEHPNIIGTKDASGNLGNAIEIARRAPKDFLLISGDDLLTLPLISVGAKGVISVLGNALPEQMQSIVKPALANDMETAQKALHQIAEINPLMYDESNPVGVKQLLSEMGICSHDVRLPLMPASESLQEKIRGAYQRFLVVEH
ncbi:4-hydroxy-tetrahydrodipicolinate synthase [Persicobacter psychrovividus]|uniref:4-hydroxy-tetrahydrodipicolinate synthase n=1 Tax=Persicobacter psychrovividus TaxID=387638 RepID=A0ABM7VFA5_9BACT|nr:4-hydroxy-tetrahydrodipicolinate synthase [Persicobacter psychrovividus]